MGFVISVPIPVSIPIPMPRFTNSTIFRLFSHNLDNISLLTLKLLFGGLICWITIGRNY